MTKGKEALPETVNASPVKSFFVTMFTRDIRLEEAILDLLDNCVDGILRSKKEKKGEKPYQGYWAVIEFNKDSFSISDNCGGIPWKFHDYAFRMGRSKERPNDTPGTVGQYGIGMKRAIFKMGRQCLISTETSERTYEVEITPSWIESEQWVLPVREAKRTSEENGTTIVVGTLYPGIAARFGEDAQEFRSTLTSMIATHYAFIIEKGFEVRVNGIVVSAKPTKLVFNMDQNGAGSIRPYIFRGSSDGVEVFLAVGFTRPIPTEAELADEHEEKKYSSLEAGWTVVCNDRAVLYCDRTELTGWGEAGVARYHTQFIAISGIVEFRSADATKLPTTTTKRGIEASSPLFLQVKNKMREGMKLFIDYTNLWRGRLPEAKQHIEGKATIPFYQVKREAESLDFQRTRKSLPNGEQYKPSLPAPKEIGPKKRRISYLKEVGEVEAVAGHLFPEIDLEEISASDVGERCFDLILDEANR